MSSFALIPVIMDVNLPAGVLGADPVSYDVRCFLLPHADGVTLIDAGYREDPVLIAEALTALGADWADVTDIILTHDHVDHVLGLPAIVARAPGAKVWAGSGDTFSTPVLRLGEGDVVRGVKVVATPGHTPGHLSLFQESDGVLFPGDVVGNMFGHLVMAPEMFTADAAEAARSLRKLAALPFDRMVFSHGEELPDPASAIAELIERSDPAS